MQDKFMSSKDLQGEKFEWNAVSPLLFASY